MQSYPQENNNRSYSKRCESNASRSKATALVNILKSASTSDNNITPKTDKNIMIERYYEQARIQNMLQSLGFFSRQKNEFTQADLTNEQYDQLNEQGKIVNVENLKVRNTSEYEMRLNFLSCGRCAIPNKVKKNGKTVATNQSGKIEIHRFEQTVNGITTFTHGYKGLKRCANSHFCPICGSKIAAHRREEIQQISEHMIKAGYQTLFITLTAPHAFKQKGRYLDSIGRFQEAVRRMKSGRKYQEFKNKYGIKFFIRSMELTVDEYRNEYRTKQTKTGIHWHSHTIAFFDRDKPFTHEEVKEIQENYALMWYNALNSVNYMDNLESKKTDILRRVDIRLPSTKDDGQIENAELIQRLSAYITKGFAFEMASHSTKQAKNPNRLSFYDFLNILSKEKNAPRRELHRAKEIIIALKGLAKLYFSQGIKIFCGLNEITDEEILEGQNGEKIFSCSDKNDNWQTVAKTGRKGHLLNYFNELAITTDNKLLETYNPTNALKMLANGIDPLNNKRIE